MISEPADAHEQEADRVAHEIMRLPDPDTALRLAVTTPKIGVQLQRKCAACESSQPGQAVEDEGKILHRKAASSQYAEATSESPGQRDVIPGGGELLPVSVQTFFAPRFNYDFSQVKIHKDPPAAVAAQVIQARVYTIGQDIVFGAGQYAPETTAGKYLLAHELTHVLQQHGNGHLLQAMPVTPTSQTVIQRQPDPQPKAAPKKLTEAETQAAIEVDKDRFQAPYVIQLIREIAGLKREPAVIDGDFARAVAHWQFTKDLKQDGMIGDDTTQAMVQSLVQDRKRLRDAILLTMDAYNLFSLANHPDMSYLTVGDDEKKCCKDAQGPTDAQTLGGPKAPKGQEGPLSLCFCIDPMIQKANTDFAQFVRIIGHELIHVPVRDSTKLALAMTM
jgi:hypothetical protein